MLFLRLFVMENHGVLCLMADTRGFFAVFGNQFFDIMKKYM